MRKLTTLLVFLLFAGLQVAFAQRTVTGRVTTAADNTPLAGVTVLVKGTTTGVVTDADGKFSIPVPEQSGCFAYSPLLVLQHKEIPVGAQTILTFPLKNP